MGKFDFSRKAVHPPWRDKLAAAVKRAEQSPDDHAWELLRLVGSWLRSPAGEQPRRRQTAESWLRSTPPSDEIVAAAVRGAQRVAGQASELLNALGEGASPDLGAIQKLTEGREDLECTIVTLAMLALQRTDESPAFQGERTLLIVARGLDARAQEDEMRDLLEHAVIVSEQRAGLGVEFQLLVDSSEEGWWIALWRAPTRAAVLREALKLRAESHEADDVAGVVR